MLVNIDKKTGELVLKLPDELNKYESELTGELINEFAFESMNPGVLKEIDNYIVKWFKDRNIEIAGKE